MRMMLQDRLKDRRRPYGQEGFITHCVEIPVPYSLYPEILGKKIVWTGMGRRKRPLSRGSRR